MEFLIEKIIEKTEKEKHSVLLVPRYYTFKHLYKDIEKYLDMTSIENDENSFIDN